MEVKSKVKLQANPDGKSKGDTSRKFPVRPCKRKIVLQGNITVIITRPKAIIFRPHEEDWSSILRVSVQEFHVHQWSLEAGIMPELEPLGEAMVAKELFRKWACTFNLDSGLPKLVTLGPGFSTWAVHGVLPSLVYRAKGHEHRSLIPRTWPRQAYTAYLSARDAEIQDYNDLDPADFVAAGQSIQEACSSRLHLREMLAPKPIYAVNTRGRPQARGKSNLSICYHPHFLISSLLVTETQRKGEDLKERAFHHMQLFMSSVLLNHFRKQLADKKFPGKMTQVRTHVRVCGGNNHIEKYLYWTSAVGYELVVFTACFDLVKISFPLGAQPREFLLGSTLQIGSPQSKAPNLKSQIPLLKAQSANPESQAGAQLYPNTTHHKCPKLGT